MYRTKGSKCNRYKSGIKSSSWVRIVTIGASYKPVLDEIIKYLGYGYLSKKPKSKNRPMWYWIIGGKENINDFLNRVLPFLHEKRIQAELMLREVNGESSGQEIAPMLKQAKRFRYDD